MTDTGWLIGFGVAAFFIWVHISSKREEAEREERANALRKCCFCKSWAPFKDLKRENWWREGVYVCHTCFARYGICAKCNGYTERAALAPFWHLERVAPRNQLSGYAPKSPADHSLYCPACYRDVTRDELKIIDAFKRCPSSQVEQQRYHGTFHWQRLRAKFHSNACKRCEACGATNTQLDLHHRHYKTIGSESLDDLELLCRTCHEQRHPQNIYVGPRGGRYRWVDQKRKYL